MVATILAGCGSSDSATLYLLFDASQSYSATINDDHRDTAQALGLEFCRRHPGDGEILLNVITSAAATGSRLRPLRCPERKNETDFRERLLFFEPQLRAAVEELTILAPGDAGSDVVGAMLYAGRQSFMRFKPDVKYLVVFSDMQHSESGVRNCVRGGGFREGPKCIGLYFKKHPDEKRDAAVLEDVSVFVIGFGINIRGALEAKEQEGYRAFWRTLLAEQRARVCWFDAARLPIEQRVDGTTVVDSKYFGPDCPPVL